MGRWSRARARVDELSGTARALPEVIPLIGRALRQLIRVNVLDCASRLAAQTFLSALPALFVVAVFAPASIRNGLLSSLREQLGLQGATADQVQQVMANPHDDESHGFGVLGALITILSATALSRAMQRVCERCWELPRSPTRLAAWRWLAWVVIWLTVLALQAPLRKGFGLGWWLGLPLTMVVGTLLWWWTQHLLLGGRVRWLPLLPGALLCGAAMTGVGVASQVYLPHAMARSVAQFGPYGVFFTFLSWLIVLFTAVTFAIALGRVMSEEEPLAQLLGPEPALRPRPAAKGGKRSKGGRGGGAGDGDGDGGGGGKTEGPADRSGGADQDGGADQEGGAAGG
ncbi:hypothetical protein GCM10009665_69770 [Kitasatospora nipponensis]|uniref:YihY family inner membrane protein n=1 Tax=Kitasatospora nipponensis TaxID=258049 RepID=A0ABP4HKZ0_9ACTN